MTGTNEHTKDAPTPPAGHGPVDRLVRPTHWMDDRGLVVRDEWLQSSEATSDWRDAYVIPCRMTRNGVKPIYTCRTCSGTGDAYGDGDPCHDCGGSGGLVAQAA